MRCGISTLQETASTDDVQTIWLRSSCIINKLSRHTIYLVPDTIDDNYTNDYDDLHSPIINIMQ